MSTELFRVRVLHVAGVEVLVEVEDTHHRTSPPETVAFFFAALYEPAVPTSAPLARACTPEQLCDEVFVERATPIYVERVEVVDTAPPTRATYLVRFTHPDWTVHLRPGLAFGTASDDVGEPVLRERLGNVVPARRRSAPIR